MADRFILLTGCSGGGKSTLLDALGAHGFATVPEPGRRIVANEISTGGEALPWVDMKAFAERAVEMARADLKTAERQDGPVFFDRGLIDAAVALEHSGGPPAKQTLGHDHVYAKQVFVVPPWNDIFIEDDERRHSFEDAVQEHHRIMSALAEFGYDAELLPQMSVNERVELVLRKCRIG